MTKPLNKDAYRIIAIIFALILFNLDSYSNSNSLWKNVACNLIIGSHKLKASFIEPSVKDNTYNLQPFGINCPENINTNTDLNECFATINSGLDIETAEGQLSSLTWKMTGVTVAESANSGINQIGSYIFNVGVTFIDYTAKDLFGNTTNCTFTVVVADNQTPEFIAPENISVACNSHIPSAYTTLQAFLNAGGNASDNCMIRPTAFSLISEEKDQLYCPYTITRNYQVADYSGNIASVTQLIFVEAEEAEQPVEESSDNQVSLKSAMAGDYTAVQSGNWDDPNTWGGIVPSFDDNVTIPSGTTVTVNAASVCNNITIESGGGVNYSGTQTLKVYGNWSNSGTFNPGTNGVVEFTGTTSAAISGNTTFEELVISKGSLNTLLTVTGTNSVSSSGSITMTSGLLTIQSGGSFTINPASDITINNAAGFDVTGGTLSTGNCSITNNGLIRISSGTANFGSSSANTIRNQSNGAFIVTGGNVNISGILYGSASGTLSPLGLTSGISISNGTVTLATSGNTQNNVGSLNVTSSGNFAFSGGTVVFRTPSSASTKLDLALISGAGTKNTVGGTFQFGNGSTPAGSVFTVSTNILINHITSNAAADLRLSSDLLVNQLALNSSSHIDLNGNSLRLTVSGTGTKTFPLENGSGNPIPVSVTFTSGSFTGGAYIEIETVGSKHPDNANTNDYLKRYWTISSSGITNPVYNITATYSNSDVTGSESNIAMGTWSGSKPWDKFGNANTSANTITATGISTSNIQLTGITSAPPSVEINNGDANAEICFGSSTTLTAVATGDPTFSYSWSPSAGLSAANIANPNANPTSTTIYTVTVTDGNGFTANDDIEVIVHPTPTATAPVDQQYCNNEITSAIPLTGTPSGVVFDISNGSSIGLANQTGVTAIPSFTASANTATITITPRANSCTGSSVSYNVTVYPTPTANTPGNKTYCSGVATSAIPLTGSPSGVVFDITGGSSIGLVNRTDVTQIPSFTPVEGNATVTITPKANGCTGNAISYNITVTAPITASAAIADPIECYGGTTNIIISASGGTSPYTFNFDGKPSNTNGVFSAIAGSVAGTNYNWSVTDVNGCAAFTGNIIVTQPEELTAGAAVTSPITCNGGTGTVTITATGGTTPRTYKLNGISSSTGVFNNVVAGTGLSWSVTDANNCGPVTGTIDVTQPVAISITSATVTTPIPCNGGTGSVTIIATGGTGTLHYTFNGQTNTSGVFNNVYAGTSLSYNVTDDNGCGPLFGSIDVSEPAAITASAAVTSAILCNGGTANVTITASGGSGALTYTFNGNSNSNGIFSGVSAGTNIPWSVTDANGCGPVTGNLSITQPALLNASVSETTPISCYGGAAEVKITSSGGTGSKTYTFNGNSNSTGVFTGVTAQNGINWNVEDANGCTVSGTYDVTQPTQIIINSIGSNSAICNGSVLNLTSSATGGTGTLRYSWTGPNGYTANNAQNPSVINATPAASGTYTLTVTDANNCTAVATTAVTVFTTPTMNPVSDIVDCDGSAITTIIFSGADSYDWTNDDTSIGLGASGSGNISSFTATNTTNAPVTATITVTPTTNGCTGTPQIFTITVNPTPNVVLAPQYSVYCNESEIQIGIGGNVSGTTYSWVRDIISGSINGGTSSSGTATTSISQDIDARNGGALLRYIVTPTANGCVGEPDTAYVEFTWFDVDENFNITGTSENATVCPGDAIQYNLNSQNGNWYYIRFWWEVDNPNVGLALTGGPLNNNKSNNRNISETVSFTATNNTGVPQTATIVFKASAHDDGWASTFLCDVASETRTITVDPFDMVCPSDYVQSNDPLDCGATINTDNPVFTCPPASSIAWDIYGATSASGSNYLGNQSFNVGTTTVDYSAQDAYGNITSCTYKVMITDDEAPVISNCPPDFNNIPMDAGECGAVITWTTPTANDNCDGAISLTRTDGTGLNSGDIFPEGTTTISYVATDAAGNSSICSFNVTVAPDNEPPAMTCIASPQEVCAAPGEQYVVPDNSWNAVVTDNCSGTISKSYTLSGVTSGSGTSLANVGFNVGTTTVTWTATDINSNTNTCSFDVIVSEEPLVLIDQTAPSACLNGSITLTSTVTGTPTLTYQWRRKNTSGVWENVVNGGSYSGATSADLTINPVVAADETEYILEVTNSCTTASSNNVFLDVSSLPQITQQPASQSNCRGESVLFRTTVTGGSGNLTYYWERKRPTDSSFNDAGNDNRVTYPNPGEMLVDRIGRGASPNGTEYRVTVTDDCGNGTASQIAVLTVNFVDSVATIHETICQGEGTSFTMTTTGSTPIDYIWRKYDESAGNWPKIKDGGAYSGATTATLTISNATPNESGMYTARAVFNVTVPNIDNVTTCTEADNSVFGELVVDEGPDIVASVDDQTICPGSAITDIVLTNANGTPGTTYTWTRNNASVLTGIPASGSGSTISGILNSTDPTNLQTTVFTITATANGCVSTGQVTVSVIDDEEPITATCPSDISVDAQTGICGAVVNYTTPTFDDNCDGNGLAGTMVSGLAPGATFPVGTTTVVYEYTDIAGNGTATCSFNVTVTDNIVPVAVCKDFTVQLDASGIASIIPADIDNGSTDNCGTPILSIDITTFDCTDLGSNTVVLTATDSVGNTASCSATVTVKDDNNPVDITATVSQQDTLCLDDLTVVNIAATGGVGTLEYTFDGTPNSSGQFTVQAGHSYAWSVANSLGCGTTSGSFYVESRPDAGTPVFTMGSATLCQDASNETYTATATNSNSISYSVSPAGAGTINASTGEMDWNAAFSGTATITATATGYCNITSEDFTVDITPTVGTPTAITVASGTEPSCQLTNGTTTTTYATTASDNTGFNWSLSDPSAGSIDPSTGIMTWSNGFHGTVDIQVTANGCNGPSAQVVRTVNITPTVGTPSVPSPTDSTICQGSSPTGFTTFASDATDYNWTVTGSGNSISGTGTTATVTWDPAFSGTATVSVTANGCNGPSSASSTTVTVLPTPIVTISGDVSVCQNSAPDPEIIFTNPQSLPVTLTYNINGGSSQTINIDANSNNTITNSTVSVGDFVYTLESVYYQSGRGVLIHCREAPQ